MDLNLLKIGDCVELTNKSILKIENIELDTKNAKYPFIINGKHYSRYGIAMSGNFRHGIMQFADLKKDEIMDKKIINESITKFLNAEKKSDDVTSHQPQPSFRQNSGKPQFSCLYTKFIRDLMDHMTKSKAKHPDIDGKPNYYRKPENIKTQVLDSGMRHFLDLYEGNLIDKDSGTHNIICCAANLMIAYYHKEALEEAQNEATTI